MKFSEHYATKFVEAGIMTVDEIFEGTDTNNEKIQAVINRLKVIEDRPLMDRLGKLKGMGVDIMAMLDYAEKQAQEVLNRVTTITPENSIDKKALLDD